MLGWVALCGKRELSGRIVGLNRGSIVHGRRCERGKPPSSDGAGVLGRGGRTLAEPQEPLVDAPSGMRGVVCIVVCIGRDTSLLDEWGCIAEAGRGASTLIA
jgi:hypothetical protein